MDTLHLLLIFGGAVGGALAGAIASYWPLNQTIIGLRARLERAELAHNGAVERSAQAREQIAQLNRAITELRRSHSAPASQAGHDTARKEVDKALAEGDEKTLVLPRRDSAQAFADTQVMADKR